MIMPARPTAHLAAVASALPATSIGTREAAGALQTLFPDEDPALIVRLVENSGVERRHLALDLDAILRPRGFTERNVEYQRAARTLAVEAARTALARAQLDPTAIDVVLDVSCTGVTIPALDVDLVPLLGLRSDVRRIPITESGCAAGALALGLAGQFAQQGQTSLVVAVELCSLTLCREDASRTNLVASVLFGDGAAAAIVAPDTRGPRLCAVGSHLFEGTREMMGFDIGTHGLKIVLQRELPGMLTKHLRAAIEQFLVQHERTLDDVGLHLVHPGGRRILEAYSEMFGLGAHALQFSHEALRRYGNLSSASILAVLELALAADARPAPGLEMLVLGIGPGLSMELSLWSFDG